MSNIRQVILETLCRRGPLPVDDIARAAHHSVMALRYHLAQLVDEGLVVSEKVERTGAVGRPLMLYALSETACERLPKRYDLFAGRLLDEMANALGEQTSRAWLRRLGRREAKTGPLLRKGASLETRVRYAAIFLSERGYAATWEKTNGGLALSVCNCPYRHIAQTHPEICEMDRAMVGAILDTPFQLTARIADHAAQCRFAIDRKS